jgi:hypothetical protein
MPNLREEICHAAARLIAEEGADYASAKLRAADEVCGGQKINAAVLPDNAQVQAALRDYQALYQAETQPARLLHLRRVAYEIMQTLEQFSPYLVGAAANGTAGEYSDIHLHLHTDENKEVEIFLLNLGADFEANEQRKNGRSIETLSFMWPLNKSASSQEGVHLHLVGAFGMEGSKASSFGRASLFEVKNWLENV